MRGTFLYGSNCAIRRLGRAPDRETGRTPLFEFRQWATIRMIPQKTKSQK